MASKVGEGYEKILEQDSIKVGLNRESERIEIPVIKDQQVSPYAEYILDRHGSEPDTVLERTDYDETVEKFFYEKGLLNDEGVFTVAMPVQYICGILEGETEADQPETRSSSRSYTDKVSLSELTDQAEKIICDEEEIEYWDLVGRLHSFMKEEGERKRSDGRLEMIGRTFQKVQGYRDRAGSQDSFTIE